MEITFFLQNSTQPFSILPQSLHEFCLPEEPQHLIINSKTSWKPICRTKVFQSSFFPCCIKIWNGRDPDLQNIDSYKEFSSKISPFIKIKSKSIFTVHYVYGVKLLSRLRLNFSHLNQHKVRYVFFKTELTVCVIVAQPQKQHDTFSCNTSSVKQ